MKKIIFLVMLFCIASTTVSAQESYHNGGPLEQYGGMTNSSGQFVLAPAGHYWNKAGQGNTWIGWGGTSNSYAYADTFTVPAGNGWNINRIVLYAFQQNIDGPLSLPFTGLFMQIWNGDPSLPSSSIILGDLTTNVLDVSFINDIKTYRVGFNSPSYSSRIFSFHSNLAGQLQPGTYWIAWSWTSTGPVYFPTKDMSSGTAKYKNLETNAWSDVVDPGSNLRAKLPFIISYSNSSLSNKEFNKNANFSMYPVPAGATCNFKLKGTATSNAKTIEVYDLRGTKILQENINAIEDDLTIDTSPLSKGIYLVRILDSQSKTIFSSKLAKG